MEPLLDTKTGRRIIIRVVIVVAIIFEFWPQLTNLSLPRSPETVQAIHAYQLNPSEAMKAAMLVQMHRDVLHNERLGWILEA
jgi:hypothetical protein